MCEAWGCLNPQTGPRVIVGNLRCLRFRDVLVHRADEDPFKKTEKSYTMASAQETEKYVAPAKIEDGPVPVQTIDPELEKRVRRKLDMNLIPLVSALYLRTSLYSTHAPDIPLTHCSCLP